MAKLSRARKKERQQARENKSFLNALIKVHERLTIMLDHNLKVKIDPCESDVLLLEELYRWYDTSTLDFTQLNDSPSEDPEQIELTADKKADNQ